MPMKKTERYALKAAIAADIKPAFQRDTLTLQLDRKRVILVGAKGRVTAASGFYQRETGRLLPRALDNAPAPVRVGNSEFLTVRGKTRRLRTWDAGENVFNYTNAGIKWYQTRRVEAVVSVPVEIDGVNATTGAGWRRDGYLPVEQVRGKAMGSVLVRANATTAEQIEELKKRDFGSRQ